MQKLKTCSNERFPEVVQTDRRYQRRMLAPLMLMMALVVWSANCQRAIAQSDSPHIPTIEWDTTIGKFQFDADKFIGQRLTLKCPSASAKQSYDGVCGTDFYPSTSSICVAALHAGVISEKGGMITLQLVPGRSEYKGSTNNGVETGNLPETARSIVFIDDSVSDEVNQIHLENIPQIKWNTKFTSTGFANRKLVGQRFTFRCPSAPTDLVTRTVFGTDSYPFASNISRAALHAGKITKEKGGIVTIQIDPGVARFAGSIRNGVETKNKGDGKNARKGERSISFVSNPVVEEAAEDAEEKTTAE